VIDVVVPCSCPNSPHEQDTVSLHPVVDVAIGAAATAAMSGILTVSDMEGALASAFIHFGPRAWTCVDDKGEPLPLTPTNIDARLTWANGGMEVAEKANELYAGDALGPLLRRRQKASPSGQTDDSTSPTLPPGSPTDSSEKPSLRSVTGGKRSGAKAS
jgi:hypothetical protein